MSEPGGAFRSRRREGRRGRGIWLGAIVLLLAGLAAYLYLARGSRETPVRSGQEYAAGAPGPRLSPEPTLAPEGPATGEPPPTAAAPAPLPELERSDPGVREELGRLSSRRELATWLVSQDLLRRFVAAVDNVAQGESPKPQLDMLAPDEGFRVLERGERIVVDPSSYRRYDAVADVFSSVDARAVARAYELWKSLIEEAYRELGYPEQRFDETLRRAIERLLATPVLLEQAELTPLVLTYGYRAPELEGLSEAEKQFLRMGPRNVRQVQAKLREIAVALGIPVA